MNSIVNDIFKQVFIDKEDQSHQLSPTFSYKGKSYTYIRDNVNTFTPEELMCILVLYDLAMNYKDHGNMFRENFVHKDRVKHAFTYIRKCVCDDGYGSFGFEDHYKNEGFNIAPLLSSSVSASLPNHDSKVCTNKMCSSEMCKGGPAFYDSGVMKLKPNYRSRSRNRNHAADDESVKSVDSMDSDFIEDYPQLKEHEMKNYAKHLKQQHSKNNNTAPDEHYVSMSKVGKWIDNDDSVKSVKHDLKSEAVSAYCSGSGKGGHPGPSGLTGDSHSNVKEHFKKYFIEADANDYDVAAVTSAFKSMQAGGSCKSYPISPKSQPVSPKSQLVSPKSQPATHGHCTKKKADPGPGLSFDDNTIQLFSNFVKDATAISKDYDLSKDDQINKFASTFSDYFKNLMNLKPDMSVSINKLSPDKADSDTVNQGTMTDNDNNDNISNKDTEELELTEEDVSDDKVTI